MEYKIKRLAGILAALAVIGTALFGTGRLVFETKENADICRRDQDARIVKTEKDIVGLQGDVKYIREAVDRIDRKLP